MAQGATHPRRGPVYPPARRSDRVDNLHGTPVADPYRWLEYTGGEEAQAWIAAQDRLARRYLASLPGRDCIRQRLIELRSAAGLTFDYRTTCREPIAPNEETAELLRAIAEQTGEHIEWIGSRAASHFLIARSAEFYARIGEVDLSLSEPRQLREIVPPAEHTPECGALVAERLFISYFAEGRSELRMFGLDGSPCGNVRLPGVGVIRGICPERGEAAVLFVFESTHAPAIVYRYDLKTGESSVFCRPDIPWNADAFDTIRVFTRSTDGCRIPLTLTYRKGVERHRRNRVLLSGYGGFQSVIKPEFQPWLAIWLEQGGIYARAGIRGGGEYGRSWHRCGSGRHKQNGIADFVGAAEWLIDNRYTSAGRVAIVGGSNGGLLVGACLTQRPELFGAALASAGVMDMLRFHTAPVGASWKDEYGDPGVPTDFRELHAYSPLHNVRKGTAYPPSLLATCSDDEIVAPWHSYKFAAALQHAQRGPNPILLRIDPTGGHAGAASAEQQIDLWTDQLAFLTSAMDSGCGCV